MNPELVSVLQVEPNGSLGNIEVDVKANAIFDVSKDVANVNANDADRDSNLKRVGVNVAGDLENVSLTKIDVIRLCLP